MYRGRGAARAMCLMIVIGGQSQSQSESVEGEDGLYRRDDCLPWPLSLQGWSCVHNGGGPYPSREFMKAG